MKSTFFIWGLIFVLAFFTAGFFPALLITALSAGGSVSTGLHAHELGSGGTRKSLY